MMVLKAAKATYIFGAAMGAVPALGGALAVSAQPSVWPYVALPLGLMIFMLAWASRFKITLTEEMLEYRTLFSRKEIPRSAIERCSLEIGCKNRGDSLKPTIRLVVHSKKGSGFSPVEINAKVFKRTELKKLRVLLGEREEGMRFGVFE